MNAWVRLPDFECAICQRMVDMRWHVRASAKSSMEPICAACEAEYSKGIAKPKHGAFRDRREVMRGFALAEALRCAAMQKEWNSHGIA
ncbi:hypothetical protein BRX36_20240 [Sphingomonas sp. S-NIH.Pt1_0416]|uniref:hypothetical protein n=1 Tax=Sphingomonas sp. S-NIH.Pt1_0416 TaxID=1920123 RepID=UPI000F7F5F09|nr:hypothetical protein [Sphingomonas sp. S-NIH.Pt1_0416]RSU58595.1 hypothetical protein BRX36_20240 [Sphingomonas sp. S-NIH.Pt1_0416]